MPDEGPLKGLRILDFCWIGAGALVTKALAELGADVIRIESRTRPDNLRLAPPFRPGTEGDLEGSGYFASRNPGKRSFALNMRDLEARRIALKLAARVDVVSSNFRPGVMERWGMSYEDVKAVNEAVVYLTMPMQGHDGPHSGFIGFGSTIAALSGLAYLSGHPDRIPVGTGTHYPDHVPNPGHALVATLAALYHRSRTGRGQAVELSQLESTVNVLGPAVLAHAAGVEITRSADRMSGVVPRRAFSCSDGWMVIAVRTDEQWAAMARVLGSAEWIEDARFSTAAARDQHSTEAEDLVAAALTNRARAETISLLVAAGVPAGPVNSSRDVLEDPTLTARGFWYESEHPVIGSMPMFRLPICTVGGRRDSPSRPPLLGEHTWEVASSLLGMTRVEYDRLVAEEVLI